jgi:hypothetical protein
MVVGRPVRHVKEAIRHQHEAALAYAFALLGALFILRNARNGAA